MQGIVSRKEVAEQLEKIKEVDILIGIPSYNNVRTIGHVVKAVQAGLNKYFPGQRSVLVNSDGGSTDGTADVVKNTVIEDFDSILLHHRIDPFFKISYGLWEKEVLFAQYLKSAVKPERKPRGGRFGFAGITRWIEL
jgi:glycosyltransferase involved in cell wall biosynthesis